jgi:predicted kinase
MKIYIVGAVSSGKSTLAKRLDGFIVSTDSIRGFLWGNEAIIKHSKLVFTLAENITHYMLSINENVVFDATNVTIKGRKKYIDLGRKYNAKVILHWIDCPLQAAIKRNKKRERKVPEKILKAFYNRFQAPTLNEGMNILNIYNENLELIDVLECHHK